MAGTTPRRLLLVIVPLVAVVPASAKDYMVGDSSGWKSGVDYAAWAKGKPFAIGDTLCTCQIKLVVRFRYVQYSSRQCCVHACIMFSYIMSVARSFDRPRVYLSIS
jgi:hypothetical protein